ncbi:hypothetical protein TNCV_1187511 [Trichonephila clavipes]|nr:hypothetical protein TNCV_1187511 [Trichonephila clavipes]
MRAFGNDPRNFESWSGGYEDIGIRSQTSAPWQLSSRYGGTLNSRRAASPLVKLVKEEKRWETPDHSQGILPLNWDGTEQNRTVICMVF